MNRKTNIFGIIGLVLSIAKMVVDALQGQAPGMAELLLVGGSASTAIGLTQAKDDNVSGAGPNAVRINKDGSTETKKQD